MNLRKLLIFGVALACLPALVAQVCLECHKKVTPSIVSDWQVSRHAKNNVECSTCHGEEHTSAQDAAKARIPMPETCAGCHAERVKQFQTGKHALGWAAMKGMLSFRQPMAPIEVIKGFCGCHRIGLKSEGEIRELGKQGGVGVASCDACHTRHAFSMQKARQPQACQTCHMGSQHPQWETYSTSKHGVQALLRQTRTLPETVTGPTCQTCHMPNRDHAVQTAWGALAVRLPMPEDKQWAADGLTILKAVGVLDPEGKPTGRLEAVKQAKLVRLTQEDWQRERDKMLRTCNRCHSANFARGELEKADRMIREADRLMAEAIETVAALYKDGVLAKPREYAYPYPDLLFLHGAATPVEQKLFVMLREHRVRTLQGIFHANPDYAQSYGWSEMKRDLAEIKQQAAELRREARTR